MHSWECLRPLGRQKALARGIEMDTPFMTLSLRQTRSQHSSTLCGATPAHTWRAQSCAAGTTSLAESCSKHAGAGLFFFLAKWEVSLLCRHIPGTQNGAADTLGMISLISEASAGGEHSTHRAVRRPATVPGAGDPRLDKISLFSCTS